ncbi:DnaJ-like protein [Aureococcus anophagefferens]|uniref:DnaJ-like protein n=2 Tax=Aureococcus anophagefferens TaxID=44056 RepID=A0ABR1FQV0_AURAN
MAQNVYLDDWAILGVPPGSDQDAIRKAYRKQALLHHPDKGGDPAKFRQVAEAYVALSEASGAATPRSTRTDYATADPYEIFARFFGAAPAHPLINHVSPENLFSPGVHGPGWEPYGEETKDPDRAAASPWADMLNADGVGPGSSAAWEERRSRLVGSSTPRATPAPAPEAGSLEAAWQKARGGAEGS